MNKYFWFFKSDDEWRYFSSKRKAVFYARTQGYDLRDPMDLNDDYITLGEWGNTATVTREYVE